MAHQSNTPFQALRIAVLTVSDTRTLDTDTSGKVLVEALESAGHALHEHALVANATGLRGLYGTGRITRLTPVRTQDQKRKRRRPRLPKQFGMRRLCRVRITAFGCCGLPRKLAKQLPCQDLGSVWNGYFSGVERGGSARTGAITGQAGPACLLAVR